MSNTNKKPTGLTNYAAAVNWLHKGLVICNNLPNIDPSVFDNMRKNLEDEETGASRDIFQWFITGFNEWDVEWMEETFPDLIFTFRPSGCVRLVC